MSVSAYVSVDARLLLVSLAVAAVFSWFFEQIFLPGPTGALFAGIIAGTPALPFLAPLLFFMLGLLFDKSALEKYLPAATLSFLPIFLAGAGLTALVLSYFVHDIPSLVMVALGAGAGAPLVVSYMYRKAYAENSQRALLTSAVLTLFSLLFAYAWLSSTGSLHLLRVLLFTLLLVVFEFVGSKVDPRSGESVLFMLALGYILGSLFENVLGPPAYFLGGVLASHALKSSPRPLRKAVLGGITLVIFLALGAHARLFNLTSLAVLLSLLAARVLYYVVVHRLILPGTFITGRESLELSMDLLPLGAPFLYALAQFSPPDVYSGALVAAAILQGIAYTSSPVGREEAQLARLESIHVASVRGDRGSALAFLCSLVVIYMLVPLSLEYYWLPFALLIPFYLAVYFLRHLTHSITGKISEELSDAYLFAYALVVISLASFALVSLHPSPYVVASAVFALFALYYLRHTARLFFPRPGIY